MNLGEKWLNLWKYQKTTFYIYILHIYIYIWVKFNQPFFFLSEDKEISADGRKSNAIFLKTIVKIASNLVIKNTKDPLWWRILFPKISSYWYWHSTPKIEGFRYMKEEGRNSQAIKVYFLRVYENSNSDFRNNTKKIQNFLRMLPISGYFKNFSQDYFAGFCWIYIIINFCNDKFNIPSFSRWRVWKWCFQMQLSLILTDV